MLDIVNKLQQSGKLKKVPALNRPRWPIPPKEELLRLIATLGTLQDVADYYGVPATNIYRFKAWHGI